MINYRKRTESHSEVITAEVEVVPMKAVVAEVPRIFDLAHLSVAV